jgi:hypothetical protein
MIEVVGTPETASNGASAANGLELEVVRSLESLATARERLVELVVEARDMDALAAALPVRWAEVERLGRELEEAVAANAVEAARLQELESALESERSALKLRRELLDRRETVLEEEREELAEQARALEERAARFHWRWLVRAWRWCPPLPRRKERVCELLFVPGAEGYKLLEQSGLALAPNARLSGLLDEDRAYVVTKIAQMPFDGRWCAYLQQAQ